MKRRHFINGANLSATALFRSQPLNAESPQWQRDGLGASRRLGILVPDFDPVPESEMWAMVPAGVSIHAARVSWKGDPRAFAEPPHVDRATEQLVALGPRAILFAFTSSSYALGAAADNLVRTRLEKRAQGIPVMLTCQAATAALRLLQIQRLSIIHPPWFSDDSNDQGMTYFRAQGFNIVQCTRITPARSFTEVAPTEVFTFVRAKTTATAEAVFIGGNGLRAVSAIRALEAHLQKPVLSANQVLLWDALRALGVANEVARYGSIFVRLDSNR